MQSLNRVPEARVLNLTPPSLRQFFYPEKTSSHPFCSMHARYPGLLGLRYKEDLKKFYKKVIVLRQELGVFPDHNSLNSLVANIAMLGFLEPIQYNGITLCLQDTFSISEKPPNPIDSVLTRSKLTDSSILRRFVKRDFTHSKNIDRQGQPIDRRQDTEYVLLSYLIHQIGTTFGIETCKLSLETMKKFKEFKGKLILITERNACESCSNVISAFKLLFPNIGLILLPGYGSKDLSIYHSQD